VVVDLANAANGASEEEGCEGGALKGFLGECARTVAAQSVFKSKAAMTASMVTQKTFGVSPCRNMKLYFRRAPYDDGMAIAGLAGLVRFVRSGGAHAAGLS
jgi:hypothetical protein